MPTFAQIQEELANTLAIPDEALTEEQIQIKEQYIDELALETEGKIDSFGYFVKKSLAEADFCKEEGERLKKRAANIVKRIEYIKARYAEILQKNGIKKIKGNAYSVGLQATDVVNINDMSLLEKEAGQFVITKVETRADKAAIKSALREGIEVPGCELVKREYLRVS